MTAVTPAQQTFGIEEVQLAARNHGMPLEALRYDVTALGLHYLLIHFDIPSVWIRGVANGGQWGGPASDVALPG
jgi:hypothetical protein